MLAEMGYFVIAGAVLGALMITLAVGVGVSIYAGQARPRPDPKASRVQAPAATRQVARQPPSA